MFRVQGTICIRVDILLLAESRTPSFAQLYVFDSDTEAQVNTRCCVMNDLGREIVAKVQRVLSDLIRRNVPASWRIYKKSRTSQRSICNSRSSGNRFGNTQSPNE